MKEMRHQYTLYPDVQHNVVEGRALSLLRIPNIIYRPCLVQHIDGDTLIQQSNINKRRCIYFKDYLDELGIKIEDAWTKENRDKLTNLMKDKFKTL